MTDAAIPQSDRAYVRELAAKYLDLVHSPAHAARRQLWTDHNALRPTRPPVVFETWSFMEELAPAPVCTSPVGRRIEGHFASALLSEQFTGDDKVFPPYFPVAWNIRYEVFDIEIHREFRKDGRGVDFGFRVDHPVKDLAREIDSLKPGIREVDRELTLEWKETVEDVVGDLMEVRITTPSLPACIPNITFNLLGMEQMLLAMVDCPDALHALHRRICDAHNACLDWLEAEKLLRLNNECTQVPSGGFGCTDLLPADDFAARDRVTTRDLWAHISAQETVGISPEMYGEFVYPYYRELAERMGFVSYACCEPVDRIWPGRLEHLPNLRATAVTKWCNEEVMGEYLRGSNVIYTRKPDPTFVGAGGFDEAAYTAHIRKTLDAARDCRLQFIYRDVYTLCGDPYRAKKAVQMIRDLSEKHWDA